MTAGLFALTLAVAAPPPATGLQKGDELTFVGTVAEAMNRPPDFFRRNHSLELRVLVLDRVENWADVAVLTRLARTEDAVTGAVGVVTGNEAEKNAPPLVRLELVRVYSDGTVHLLAPEGPPPLKLTTETPVRTLPPVPLDSFAPAEFGIFAPRVPRGNAGETWTVSGTANRPVQTWKVEGDSQFVNAEQCRLLLMNQASANWAKPVGGQTAWHRADAVWVSTQDGTARRVHRVIRQRDGIAEAPAAWVEVKYQLKDQGRLGGRTFDRARRDAEVAYAALNDAARLVPDAARLGERLFETKLARLDAQLDLTDPASPYREAMLAARRLFDDARRGKVVAPTQPASALAPATPHRPGWPEAGESAPDLAAGNFRLAEHRGKPVALVFFRPGGETAKLALAIAGAAEKRYAGRLLVVPLVVFGDVAAGKAERDRQKLTLPVYDGSGAVTAFGIETAPRFVLIDGAGKVRWAFTGVGAETGFLLREEADRLAAPASPAGPGVTTPAPGPALPPILPRP